MVAERKIKIKDGERIDQLLWNDLQIIQNPSWFCFGLDAVLLADFARVNPYDGVLDLCTGNGVVPLLLSAKEPTATLQGIEIFPQVAEMAQRSVALNHLAHRIQIYPGDITKMQSVIVPGQFQVVTVNPPYRKKNQGKLSPSPFLAAAKAEVYCDLEQVVAAIAYNLAPTGRFYCIYPYGRLEELFSVLQNHDLQVEQLKPVKNFSDQPPILCLVAGYRKENANNKTEGISCISELVVFEKDPSGSHQYSREMIKMFQQYRTKEKEESK